MTPELTYLAWAIVLGLVHAFATGPLTILQHGMAYALSPRDEKKALTGTAARIERAFSNYMQTFPFFAAAILLAHLANRHDNTTVWGAALYFWGRVAYVPLYALGILGARTAAFAVSITGIVLLLLALR